MEKAISSDCENFADGSFAALISGKSTVLPGSGSGSNMGTLGEERGHSATVLICRPHIGFVGG